MSTTFAVTGWNNGAMHPSGAGFGLKVSSQDRDRFFKRSWGSVMIELPGKSGEAVVNVSKPSFWGQTCRELIHRDIGKWMLREGLAPWTKGVPPKLTLESLGAGRFRLRTVD